MRKRIFSVLLCFSMALSLLPVAALAAEYDGWEAATAEGVTLTTDTDTVTIGGVTYTYKGDASTSGIQMYTYIGSNAAAFTEACCWNAGSGYVLYNPTVVSGKTTSAVVTLHEAEISTASAKALALPYNSSSGISSPVPVTVTVEGTNSLATAEKNYYVLYHEAGDTTLTGGGTLTITNSASDAWYNFQNIDAVTIKSGT